MRADSVPDLDGEERLCGARRKGLGTAMECSDPITAESIGMPRADSLTLHSVLRSISKNDIPSVIASMSLTVEK